MLSRLRIGKRPLLLISILMLPAIAVAQEEQELTAEQQEAIEQIGALGYSGEASTDSTKAGVTRHNRDAVCPGPRLYCSGHSPAAYLIDVDGRVLHKWEMKPWDVDDSFERGYPLYGDFLRNVHLLDDGSLLVIFEAVGLAKLDKDSRVVWRVQNRAHHDLDIAENGDIYVLRHYTRVIPRIDETKLIIDDLIAVLDSEGREKDAISVLEALENSKDYSHLLRDYLAQREVKSDLLHPNSVSILDGKHEQEMPALKKGNIMVSLAYLNAVVVIDPEIREVVWAHQGPYKVQHDPNVLANGNLLVFDNQSVWGRSSVTEFTLPSMDVVWTFTASQEMPFLSKTCGTCQRLPSGNTLIAETETGRAIEVTPDGEIVWEFYNPHRTSENTLASVFMITWMPRVIEALRAP